MVRKAVLHKEQCDHSASDRPRLTPGGTPMVGCKDFSQKPQIEKSESLKTYHTHEAHAHEVHTQEVQAQ
jgi:hypothetical protein